ncbi:hypothetical protein SUGI_0205160 [Cryptomeria japonica]|nr:hypothetical protein SUGI_0205160 [Cryptomeria japonica]
MNANELSRAYKTTSMADKDGIDVTELAHLAIPNWGDVVHRRCIAASLVNVVYLLQTNKNQAKQWCDLLQFDVMETAIDENDKSIFGAVFQWQGTVKAGSGGPPSEVVAFRGTIFRPKTILEDLALDLKVATAHLDSLCRVDKGLQYLRRSIQRNGSHSIWLAGHSLGAAIALVVARKLQREERHNLEAHLFNPPFFSPSFPQLKLFEKIGKTLLATCKASPSLHFTQLDKVFKIIQGTSEALAASMGLKDEKKLLELYADFLVVSNWTPNIYDLKIRSIEYNPPVEVTQWNANVPVTTTQ